MELSLSTRVEGRYTVIEAVGEIDIYTAPTLRDRIADLIEAGACHLIMDLEGVTFFDSTGLGVLIGARKRLHAHDGSLSLVCTRESVVKVFRIMGLNTVFVFYADVDEAAATAAVA